MLAFTCSATCFATANPIVSGSTLIVTSSEQKAMFALMLAKLRGKKAVNVFSTPSRNTSVSEMILSQLLLTENYLDAFTDTHSLLSIRQGPLGPRLQTTLTAYLTVSCVPLTVIPSNLSTRVKL